MSEKNNGVMYNVDELVLADPSNEETSPLNYYERHGASTERCCFGLQTAGAPLYTNKS